MAPAHSFSLRKISALLFEDRDPASDSDVEHDGGLDKPLAGEDFACCRFERALSEDTTVPAHPFSRSVSPEASDDELEQLAPHVAPHGARLEAFPQAACLVRGPMVDPGEEVGRGRELLAVGTSGEARFVPEERLAELEALRACFEEEASPLILVARDGAAYLAPDGEHVEWGQLDAMRARAFDETVVSPSPSLASDDRHRAPLPRRLRPAARSLAPLQLEEGQHSEEEEEAAEGLRQKNPEGSVPRNPSLKKLSALLFATVAGTADDSASACAEVVEELELEGPGAPGAAFGASPPDAHLRKFLAEVGREADRSQELIAVDRKGEARFVPEEELSALEALRAFLESFEVDRSQELIAVDRKGEARFVPEEELSELEALRACLECFEEGPSPLYLVGRNGAAYIARDGESVEWSEVDAALRAGACGEAVHSPPPAPRAAGGDRRAQLLRPLCPAARSLAPLQLDAARPSGCEPAADAPQRPDGSVPRSPSLKRLWALLFAADAAEAGRRGGARARAEELELEAPEPPRATLGGRARQRDLPGRQGASLCSLAARRQPGQRGQRAPACLLQ